MGRGRVTRSLLPRGIEKSQTVEQFAEVCTQLIAAVGEHTVVRPDHGRRVAGGVGVEEPLGNPLALDRLVEEVVTLRKAPARPVSQARSITFVAAMVMAFVLSMVFANFS
jgi:hypothetical protein